MAIPIAKPLFRLKYRVTMVAVGTKTRPIPVPIPSAWQTKTWELKVIYELAYWTALIEFLAYLPKLLLADDRKKE